VQLNSRYQDDRTSHADYCTNEEDQFRHQYPIATHLRLPARSACDRRTLLGSDKGKTGHREVDAGLGGVPARERTGPSD
jgi:hypothetical protein